MAFLKKVWKKLTHPPSHALSPVKFLKKKLIGIKSEIFYWPGICTIIVINTALKI